MSQSGDRVTGETYTVTGIVCIEENLERIEHGVESKIRVNATIHKILEYRRDGPGTREIDLDTLSRRHNRGNTTFTESENKEELRRCIINSFIEKALEEEFGTTRPISLIRYLYQGL